MPGRALDNLGINSCGPAEYLRMLVEDGLPLEPAAVIVALFVGNDIVDAERYAPPQRLLRAWFDRANVMLFVVPERLAAIRAEERASDGAGAVASVAGMDGEAPVGQSLEELALAFPWLADRASRRRRSRSRRSSRSRAGGRCRCAVRRPSRATPRCKRRCSR
jgi:hypothetical protein